MEGSCLIKGQVLFQESARGELKQYRGREDNRQEGFDTVNVDDLSYEAILEKRLNVWKRGFQLSEREHSGKKGLYVEGSKAEACQL